MKHDLKRRFSGILPGILFVLLPVSLYAQEKRNFEIIGSWHNELDIKGSSGTTLSLTYETLPANQAGLNRNTLWLWAATEVPWRYPPLRMQRLPEDAPQSGSYVLEGLSITIDRAYIACYSVDTTPRQICACAHLSSTSDSTSSEWLHIELTGIDANSLSFNYTTLAGYLPQTYDNWFGLWKGAASPYNIFKPIATGQPVDDSSCNNASLNKINFEIGQVYTLIYFTGKDPSQAAAMITFRVK